MQRKKRSGHDRMAARLAKIFGTFYHRRGPDVPAADLVIEVAADRADVLSSKGQLRGFRRHKYLAVPKRLELFALEQTEGTKIGIMDADGRILRRAAGHFGFLAVVAGGFVAYLVWYHWQQARAVSSDGPLTRRRLI